MSDLQSHEPELLRLAGMLRTAVERQGRERDGVIEDDSSVDTIVERIANHIDVTIEQRRVPDVDPGRVDLIVMRGDMDRPTARTKKVANLVLEYRLKELLDSFSTAEKLGGLGSAVGKALAIPEPTALTALSALLAVAAGYRLNKLSDLELSELEAKIVLLLWEKGDVQKLTRQTLQDDIAIRYGGLTASQERLDGALDHLVKIRSVFEDESDDNRMLLLETVRIAT